MTAPTYSPYTAHRRLKDWVQSLVFGLLGTLRFPGLIKPLVYKDAVTGDFLQIETRKRFTVLSVNGRDYYFRRWTGKFDGTGFGCASTQASADYMVGHTHESVRLHVLSGLPEEQLPSTDQEHFE